MQRNEKKQKDTNKKRIKKDLRIRDQKKDEKKRREGQDKEH